MEQMLWWDEELEKAKLASAVFSAVEDIEKDQQGIHEANERHAKLYSGYSPPGLGFSTPTSRSDYKKYEVTKNVVKSVCDTATALIGKTRPKATFLTDGGDWEMQRKAKLLDQAIVGAFVKTKLWGKWQKAFRDATILGTACMKLVVKDGFVDAERTLIDEIIVDEKEYATRDGDPYNVYQVKVINKAVLCKKFKDKKSHELIKKASGSHMGRKWANYRAVADGYVVVIEAWHRAAGGGEGRHVISLDNGVLLDEKWKYDWFPFIFFHWSEPMAGFYGQGLAELLCGRQSNINQIYRFIRRAQELILVPRVFVDAANTLMKFHLNNEIGAVIPTRGGKPPVFYTPQALTAEIYTWLDNLEKGGYDEAGVSMMSASNKLPTGIESAPAQREYSFKEGQRFAPVSQRYEDAFIETSWKMVQLYRDMPKGIKLSFSNNKFFKMIEWKDVDMENDQYEIRIEASSIDSLSPASRTQAVIELSQTGWIDKAEGRRLLGHPDLVRSDQLNSASIEYAEWIAMQLTDGVQAIEIAPDGVAEDVMENYKHVRASYLLGKQNKLPQERLDQHLIYLKLAEEVLNTKPPMQAPPMGIMPGQTQSGMPTTTPESPMGPAMPQDANMLPPVGPPQG